MAAGIAGQDDHADKPRGELRYKNLEMAGKVLAYLVLEEALAPKLSNINMLASSEIIQQQCCGHKEISCTCPIWRCPKMVRTRIF